MNWFRLFLSLLAVFIPYGAALAVASLPAEVNVILWFDTEDYLLPADDDACKRLADMLTERKIRGTFKVVGEKARVLEKRGRKDVIRALRRHARRAERKAILVCGRVECLSHGPELHPDGTS